MSFSYSFNFSQPRQQPQPKYWCYTCDDEVNPILQPSLKCRNCNGEFIEELQPPPPQNPPPQSFPNLFNMMNQGAPPNFNNFFNNQSNFQFSSNFNNNNNDGNNNVNSDNNNSNNDGGNNNNNNDGNNNNNNGNNNNHFPPFLQQLFQMFSNPQQPMNSQNFMFNGNGNMNGINAGDYAFGNFQNIIDRLFEQQGNHGAPPASKKEVEKLKKINYEIGSENTDCAVCKDEFKEGEELIQMPCSHYFHEECLLPWLKIRNSCPVCRFELKTDDDNYEKKKEQNQNNN
eukprot:TRINITY_DN7168_c0_g1_i1.p1 TRINITY_DN7168_c0_g1~~TRINITY_DN7168_c0_g1_i1.p1  ORF type:complete len:286 (+),score=103.38 TRINITY_DN7168_c0_g1_i1:36-893(+)